MSPLSKGELLYSSGQSRLHLHIREGVLSDSNKTIDFLIFEKAVTNICKLSKFPETLDEEAVAFRSHGFPLLVWPRIRDKATVLKVGAMLFLHALHISGMLILCFGVDRILL